MCPASTWIHTGVLGGPRKCVCSREYGLKTIDLTLKSCVNHQRLSQPDCDAGPTIACLAHAFEGQREVAESGKDESFSTLSPCFLDERLGETCSHGNSRSTQRHTQTHTHTSSAVRGVPAGTPLSKARYMAEAPWGRKALSVQ